MNLAILTKSATTKSGARVPFELGQHLAKFCRVTIFAKAQNAEKDLVKMLEKHNIQLILYKNIIDLYLNLIKGNFSIISFHSTLRALLTAKLTFLPVIRTYYGTQFDAYLERFLPNQKVNFIHKSINRAANILLWFDQKLILLLSNQVIAISKAAQKELMNIFNTKSTLIYLGTNMKPATNYQLPTTRFPLRSRSEASPLTILSVSRITPYKGFHQLINVVGSIRNQGIRVNLIIAGSLQERNYFKYLQKIKGKDDQIITDPDDKTLQKLYQISDIYASCDRYLFFGLPIVEAAQFGKPAVSLNFQAAKELIIHNKTGYVADSQENLKKFLISLLRNRTKRLEMGRLAKIYAQKNFDYPKIVLAYFKAFQKLTKKHV